MQAVDVAIAGGGPAGLAAAHAILAARPGTRVAVLERSDLRPRGATFGITPNGVRALEAISPALKAAVARHHVEHATVERFDPEGNLTYSGEVGKGAAQLQEYGELISLPWHALQGELATALPPGVLHTHHVFAGLEDGVDGVVATFDTPEGRRSFSAQLLVGADGGQSAVRQALLGDGPPTFLGMAVWRAVIPVPPGWPHSYAVWGRVGQSVITSVLGNGKIVWQAFAPWPADRMLEIGGDRRAYILEEANGSGAPGVHSSSEEARAARLARCLQAFAGYPQELLDLLAGTDPASITEHGQFCRQADACQTYAEGRVALVGDAAHLATPFLGQGCSQALEDALELGRAVGMHSHTPAALAAFQAVRLPAASAVQAVSVEICQQFAAGGKMTRTEFEANIEEGFVQRIHKPLVPQTATASA